MNYKKKILLCTFTNEHELQKTLNLLNATYNIVNNKIIVLYDETDTNNIYCIYNIFEDEQRSQLQKTILLHRKRETNTLYTINSLNKLISILTDGKQDPNYKVDWSSIKDTLLLTKKNELLIINTKLLLVYKCEN